ncbi:MAG: hypothetical protein AUJ92_15170 [Armatimonadetes bacterium CG2_30_59_28]|nr:MAG: hypothetical protein AUJ92_15170 [Armatimonadetes bacterium CG2_30_59_28]PIU62566.1 MAG: UPF0182 family protein [Armatimonadetes bacterium CG07_land_8_20_14_0_80_59_28]PJB77627.1 MAG: UPF0182 family protein [Armatimonadetes bacterium CG_4_9_14_3_um_filter_58_7]
MSVHRTPSVKLLVLFLLLAFLAVWKQVLFIYTEYLWFLSVGFQQRLLLEYLSRIGLGVTAALFVFILLYGSTVVARRSVPKEPIRASRAWDGLPFLLTASEFGRHAVKYALPLSILGGALVAIDASGHWLEFWCAAKAATAGYSDPFLGKDASFYLFALPLCRWIAGAVFGVLIATLVLTSLVYLIAAALQLATRQQAFLPHAKAHIALLIAPVFLLLALKYGLDVFELLYVRRAAFQGPGYTDAHVILPVLHLGAGISILTFVLAVVNLWKRWEKPLIYCALAALAVPFVGRSVVAPAVQLFAVTPNEITCEKPFIRNNIEATLRAYDLHRVTSRDYPVDASLTSADLARHNNALASVRLWDHRPLRETYQQLQEIRSYYRFIDVDVDRYRIGDEYRQIALSPRELDVSRLGAGAKNWVNLHLKYTHGYGVCLSPVNETTPEGLPVLLIKDIPPASSIGMKIVRPEIYFGESDLVYALTNTREPEIDYPKGNTNAQCFYQSRTGVPLNSLFRRIGFAARLNDWKVLFYRGTTKDSQILFRRNIVERVRAIAPFLSIDGNPYIVISEGKLFWIIDAYTTTTLYPYSTPIARNGLNYIRNSVKVVIDAYSGETTFYLYDADDPIALTYSRIFPRFFRAVSEMPRDLQDHLRYPTDLMKIQSSIYSLYHMTDPDTFYSKEDPWRTGQEVLESRGNVQDMEPYYVIMRVPEATREGASTAGPEASGAGRSTDEFVLLVPFTPQHRPNMIAWVSARCDAPHRGEVVVYQLTKGKNVEGPMQIEALIDQDTDISALMTLWGEMGSSVIRGNLILLPIENSLLYIKPIYLKASATPLPELKRVIVAFNKRVVMKKSLREALDSLFGSPSLPVSASSGESPPEAAPGRDSGPGTQLRILAEEGLRKLNRAQEQLKSGNWKEFGNALESLESILRKMKGEQKSE